jgi:hypothetical protein
MPPLGNIYAANSWVAANNPYDICAFNVCLGGLECDSLGRMIDDFWNTKFSSYITWLGPTILKKTFGSYEKWSKMNLDQVIKVLKSKSYPDKVKGQSVKQPLDGTLFGHAINLSKLK